MVRLRPPSLALASITTEEGSGREQVGNVSEEAVVEEITKSHRLIDLCSVALKGFVVNEVPCFLREIYDQGSSISVQVSCAGALTVFETRLDGSRAEGVHIPHVHAPYHVAEHNIEVTVLKDSVPFLSGMVQGIEMEQVMKLAIESDTPTLATPNVTKSVHLYSLEAIDEPTEDHGDNIKASMTFCVSMDLSRAITNSKDVVEHQVKILLQEINQDSIIEAIRFLTPGILWQSLVVPYPMEYALDTPMTSDSLLKLSRIVHLAFSLREDETDWLWKTGDDTSKLIMWIQVASVDGLGMGEEDSEVFVELQHRGTKRRTHSAKVQASHSINFDAINLQDDTEFPESIGRFRMESGKLKAFFSESLQVAVFQKAADERPPKLVGKGSIDLSTIRDFAEDVKTWLAEVKSETADPLLHSHVVENIIHLVRDGKGNKKKIRTCSVKLRIGVELSRGGPMQNRVNLLYALVRSLALASMIKSYRAGQPISCIEMEPECERAVRAYVNAVGLRESFIWAMLFSVTSKTMNTLHLCYPDSLSRSLLFDMEDLTGKETAIVAETSYLNCLESLRHCLKEFIRKSGTKPPTSVNTDVQSNPILIDFVPPKIYGEECISHRKRLEESILRVFSSFVSFVDYIFHNGILENDGQLSPRSQTIEDTGWQLKGEIWASWRKLHALVEDLVKRDPLSEVELVKRPPHSGSWSFLLESVEKLVVTEVCSTMAKEVDNILKSRLPFTSCYNALSECIEAVNGMKQLVKRASDVFFTLDKSFVDWKIHKTTFCSFVSILYAGVVNFIREMKKAIAKSPDVGIIAKHIPELIKALSSFEVLAEDIGINVELHRFSLSEYPPSEEVKDYIMSYIDTAYCIPVLDHHTAFTEEVVHILSFAVKQFDVSCARVLAQETYERVATVEATIRNDMEFVCSVALHDMVSLCNYLKGTQSEFSDVLSYAPESLVENTLGKAILKNLRVAAEKAKSDAQADLLQQVHNRVSLSLEEVYFDNSTSGTYQVRAKLVQAPRLAAALARKDKAKHVTIARAISVKEKMSFEVPEQLRGPVFLECDACEQLNDNIVVMELVNVDGPAHNVKGVLFFSAGRGMVYERIPLLKTAKDQSYAASAMVQQTVRLVSESSKAAVAALLREHHYKESGSLVVRMTVEHGIRSAVESVAMKIENLNCIREAVELLFGESIDSCDDGERDFKTFLHNSVKALRSELIEVIARTTLGPLMERVVEAEVAIHSQAAQAELSGGDRKSVLFSASAFDAIPPTVEGLLETAFTSFSASAFVPFSRDLFKTFLQLLQNAVGEFSRKLLQANKNIKAMSLFCSDCNALLHQIRDVFHMDGKGLTTLVLESASEPSRRLLASKAIMQDSDRDSNDIIDWIFCTMIDGSVKGANRRIIRGDRVASNILDAQNQERIVCRQLCIHGSLLASSDGINFDEETAVGSEDGQYTLVKVSYLWSTVQTIWTSLDSTVIAYRFSDGRYMVLESPYAVRFFTNAISIAKKNGSLLQHKSALLTRTGILEFAEKGENSSSEDTQMDVEDYQVSMVTELTLLKGGGLFHNHSNHTSVTLIASHRCLLAFQSAPKLYIHIFDPQQVEHARVKKGGKLKLDLRINSKQIKLSFQCTSEAQALYCANVIENVLRMEESREARKLQQAQVMNSVYMKGPTMGVQCVIRGVLYVRGGVSPPCRLEVFEDALRIAPEPPYSLPLTNGGAVIPLSWIKNIKAVKTPFPKGLFRQERSALRVSFHSSSMEAIECFDKSVVPFPECQWIDLFGVSELDRAAEALLTAVLFRKRQQDQPDFSWRLRSVDSAKFAENILMEGRKGMLTLAKGEDRVDVPLQRLMLKKIEDKDDQFPLRLRLTYYRDEKREILEVIPSVSLKYSSSHDVIAALVADFRLDIASLDSTSRTVAYERAPTQSLPSSVSEIVRENSPAELLQPLPSDELEHKIEALPKKEEKRQNLATALRVVDRVTHTVEGKEEEEIEEFLESSLFWIPDDRRPTCSECSVAFHFFRRRHHCRFCGDVYCGRCSSNYLKPSNVKYVPCPPSTDKAQSICRQCAVSSTRTNGQTSWRRTRSVPAEQNKRAIETGVCSACNRHNAKVLSRKPCSLCGRYLCKHCLQEHAATLHAQGSDADERLQGRSRPQDEEILSILSVDRQLRAVPMVKPERCCNRCFDLLHRTENAY